jgi:hypothetical protein
MKVVEIPFTAKNWKLLPPPADHCQECGVKHPPDLPHNAQSMHYQYSFHLKHNRWPNWKDAMAHCTEETKKRWKESLIALGVGDVDGGQVNPS